MVLRLLGWCLCDFGVIVMFVLTSVGCCFAFSLGGLRVAGTLLLVVLGGGCVAVCVCWLVVLVWVLWLIVLCL